MYLLNKNISDKTVETRIKGIRAFFYFCMDKGYIKNFSIKNIKTEEKIKEPYTEHEINLLLKKPDLKRCTFSEYRNWVLVNYFYSTRK